MKEFQFILEYNSVSKTLDNNPAGWDSFTISYDRSPVYHSVFRSVGDTLKFTRVGVNDGGGYQFIKDAYDAEGIKAIVNITINKRNPATNDHEFFYGGILDFSPKAWNDNLKESEFEIGIVDSSKLQQFRSNEDIDIDLNSETSLDGTAIEPFVNAPYETVCPSIDIYLYAETDGQFSGSQTGTGTVETLYNDYSGNLPTNEIGDRLTINFPAEDETLYENTIDSPEQNADFYCTTFSGNSQDTITINGMLSAAFWTYKKTVVFTVYDGDGLFQEWIKFIILNKSGTGDSVVTYNDDYSFSFTARTVRPNGYITMQTECILTTGEATATKIINARTVVDNAKFIELTDGANSFGVDCYPPFEAFTRGLQLTTNETDTTKLLDSEKFGRPDSEFTTYLNVGNAALYFYTIGWNIRQYTDKAFLTKYRDMFKSYDAVFCLTQMFDRDNDRFVISNRSQAYRNEEILELENVSSFKIEPADDYYYKELLTGYPSQTFEDFQGVNEINLESEHFIDVPVKGKLDIRSLASASSIAIELARRKRRKYFESEDTKYDEQNFIIEAFWNSPLYEAVVGATNLDTFLGGEQYYNWSITPRENIIRHGLFVQAPMFKHPTQNIDKSKYQKESDAEYTNQNSELVTELSNIEQSELNSLRVHPEIYTFESVWNTEIISQLNSDPHGYVTAPYNGVDYKGFILSVSGNPSTGLATYKLIKANV